MTEDLFSDIAKQVENASRSSRGKDNAWDSPLPSLAKRTTVFESPYPEIDFIPALNTALGQALPDLSSDKATDDLVKIFKEKGAPLPPVVTLPQLLDTLASLFLEPQCDRPTWIINHPECLSPLSKSFTHALPDIPQSVAARAELFIGGQEIVNCYEEENSPLEQKRKFWQQRKYSQNGSDGSLKSESMAADEDYLRALEWGLPPTAGWGCGIDRLVMLLTGKERISDVLSFRTLRAVTRAPEARNMVKL